MGSVICIVPIHNTFTYYPHYGGLLFYKFTVIFSDLTTAVSLGSTATIITGVNFTFPLCQQNEVPHDHPSFTFFKGMHLISLEIY